VAARGKGRARRCGRLGRLATWVICASGRKGRERAGWAGLGQRKRGREKREGPAGLGLSGSRPKGRGGERKKKKSLVLFL